MHSGVILPTTREERYGNREGEMHAIPEYGTLFKLPRIDDACRLRHGCP